MALDAPDEQSIHGHIQYLRASETVDNADIDTSAHDTAILECTGYQDKSFFFKNTTDASLTIQLQASPLQDGSEQFDIGQTLSMGAGNSSPTFDTLANNDAVQYVWVQITGGSNATTGQLEIWAYVEGNTA